MEEDSGLSSLSVVVGNCSYYRIHPPERKILAGRTVNGYIETVSSDVLREEKKKREKRDVR